MKFFLAFLITLCIFGCKPVVPNDEYVVYGARRLGENKWEIQLGDSPGNDGISLYAFSETRISVTEIVLPSEISSTTDPMNPTKIIHWIKLKPERRDVK